MATQAETIAALQRAGFGPTAASKLSAVFGSESTWNTTATNNTGSDKSGAINLLGPDNKAF